MSYDLLIYGATPAGIIAAVTAAERGCRVALLEPSQHLGGMATGGLGWTDYGKEATIGADPAVCMSASVRNMVRISLGISSPMWLCGSIVVSSMKQDRGLLLYTLAVASIERGSLA